MKLSREETPSYFLENFGLLADRFGQSRGWHGMHVFISSSQVWGKNETNKLLSQKRKWILHNKIMNWSEYVWNNCLLGPDLRDLADRNIQSPPFHSVRVGEGLPHLHNQRLYPQESHLRIWIWKTSESLTFPYVHWPLPLQFLLCHWQLLLFWLATTWNVLGKFYIINARSSLAL